MSSCKVKKIGILGGGQLAQMMALEAHSYGGLSISILSKDRQDPAAQVVQHHVKGDPNNKESLIHFLKTVDFLTFESEFYDMDSLIPFEKKKNIFPRPSLMKLLQSRISQKNLLFENKIPTASFFEVHSYNDLEKAFQSFNGPFVLKRNRGGYDGYGTFYVHTLKDLKKCAKLFPDSFIAESFVPFKKELAIILVRSLNGSLISLPLVESHQVKSRCDWVLGPVQHPQAEKIIRKLSHFLHTINYVGAIGFELFDTGKELLVNEVAPRVHNTGHYSQEALKESQFLLHLKAGLGEDLQKPQLLAPHFCMVNLIGSKNESPGFLKERPPLQGKLHWYNKEKNRKGRKMGHVNYIFSGAVKSHLKKALSERNLLKV